MKKIIAVALLTFTAITSYAHSGGTDKNGCHRDHTTGGYHCH